MMIVEVVAVGRVVVVVVVPMMLKILSCLFDVSAFVPVVFVTVLMKYQFFLLLTCIYFNILRTFLA